MPVNFGTIIVKYIEYGSRGHHNLI